MATNRNRARGLPYTEAKRLKRMEEYAAIASREIETVMHGDVQLTEEVQLPIVTARLYVEMLRKEILMAKLNLEPEDREI